MVDPYIAAITGIIITVSLASIGLFVGPALALGGFVGLVLLFGDFSSAVAILYTTPYAMSSQYSLVVLPLVILLGTFTMELGMSTAGYRVANNWLGKLPGGLAIATVGGSAIYGAVCASSVATCAVFSKLSYPEMEKAGYDTKLSLGSVLSGGIIGMLIPPSSLAVIYGILTETSIAKLYMGGLGAGILVSVAVTLLIVFMVKRNPQLAPSNTNSQQISWKQRIISLKEIWGLLLLAVIMLGGVFLGIYNVIEGSAVGVLWVLLNYMFSKKRNWSVLRDAMVSAAKTIGALFAIILGAIIFSRMLSATGIPLRAVEFISSQGLPAEVVLIVVLLFYLILGCSSSTPRSIALIAISISGR